MVAAGPSPIPGGFAGHLGHLTVEQQTAFENFKKNLSKANLYRPPTDVLSASHDDATLL
jgi:hypothetical protein